MYMNDFHRKISQFMVCSQFVLLYHETAIKYIILTFYVFKTETGILDSISFSYVYCCDWNVNITNTDASVLRHSCTDYWCITTIYNSGYHSCMYIMIANRHRDDLEYYVRECGNILKVTQKLDSRHSQINMFWALTLIRLWSSRNSTR